MRRRGGITLFCATVIVVGACEASPRIVSDYPPGEPRPSREQCQGLDRVADRESENRGASISPSALCFQALSGDKAAQLEIAHLYRRNGDAYSWLSWLARAASPETRPVTVYVPPVGGEGVSPGGPATGGAAAIAGLPAAKLEIDRLLPRGQGQRASSPPVLLSDPENPPTDDQPLSAQLCGACRPNASPDGCTAWFASSFIAVAKGPQVVDSVEFCPSWAQNPEEPGCIQDVQRAIVSFDQLEILSDTSGFGRKRLYFAEAYQGVRQSRAFPLDPNFPGGLIIFANTDREYHGVRIPMIAATCELRG